MDWNAILDEIKTIGTALGTVIFTGYITYKTFSSKLEKWRQEDKVNVSKNIEKQSKLDCEIMTEADKLKELLNADRVQIYEFHNGVHYANGRSALRTSCTYEACRFGVEGCIDRLNGIPLSVIPIFIKTLLDKGELLVKDLEDIKETMPSTYNLKKSMSIQSFYDFTIHNINGEPVGFVAVQFCGENITNLNKDAVKRFAWFVESKLLEM